MDLKNIERLVQAYIDKNLVEQVEPQKPVIILGAVGSLELDQVDFMKLYAKAKTGCLSFSDMLMRLIEESGEKNSTIYKRANIDRRHFSKIANNDEYQPSKQTVFAFAIALKLDFEQTKDLLHSAGFTLNRSNLTDVIVGYFLEYKIFDLDLVNQILYKYNQPLLGG